MVAPAIISSLQGAQIADAKAYVQLMKRIKEIDKDHTVVMMQVKTLGISGYGLQ
jgi:hypothetical protein